MRTLLSFRMVENFDWLPTISEELMKSIQSHSLFRFLASLKLAVISLLSLSSVLAYATILESQYGMRGAHQMVYGTWWFRGLLFMLATNVLFAALSRLPWRKKHIGFVITHTGILVILGGSWVTQRFGIDGSLPIVEGSQDRSVILSELKLKLSEGVSGSEQHYPVPESGRRRSDLGMNIELPADERIVVEEFLPRVVPENQFEASPIPNTGTPALQVELTNSRFSLVEWLAAHHPDRPSEKNLGPAMMRIQKLWTQEQVDEFLTARGRKNERAAPFGVLLVEYNGQSHRLNIRQALRGWMRVGSSPFELKVERYLPYAVVEGKDLVSKSNEPGNPAVQLAVRDPLGTREKHTLFANFPEFATRHRAPSGELKNPFPIQLRYEGPQAEKVAGPQGIGRGGKQGELEFAFAPDDRVLYRIFNASGVSTGKGIVALDTPTPTGWMDLQFRVLQAIPAAVERLVPKYVDQISGAQTNFLTAIRFRQERGGSVIRPSTYLIEGDTKEVQIAGKSYGLSLDKEQLQLPFEIFLEKFRVGNDPGTQKAATYESLVRVTGSDSRDPASTTLISMNEPLKHGGFTFYQASYQLRDGKPPISILSVNYDPGRMIKYAGSIIMVLGIMLMFYLNPHYWDKILGGKRRSS